MRPTQELAQSTLFTQRCETLSIPDRVKLSHERAKAIGKAYALTVEDVLYLSPKFWNMHTDPIACIDGAAETLLTIQYNLCAGTLATYVKGRPDLAPLLKQVLDFEVSGQFCLTELGHGLDALHLETTATLLPDGNFDLHTPLERAAKYMPPTSPVTPGFRCVSVVFARTVVNGEDHGVKPFVLQLHDGQFMTPGVTIKVLPPRGGSRPLNHSLTSFNHVRLPPTALLGSIEKPKDPRSSFFDKINRVAVGTLALSSLCIPSLQVASLRRTIVDASGVSKPIMFFQTQKQPILTALAQTFVLGAMHKQAVAWFTNPKLDPRVRHAVATVHKAVVVQASQTANLVLGDRCGAQGLFEANQFSAMHSDIRGIAIAEGDLLGISIRLASELLLGRYIPRATALPRLPPRAARNTTYDREVLPRSLPLVLAIGHRIAYDAARAAQVDAPLAGSIRGGGRCCRTRRELRRREAHALEAVFAHLEEYLVRMDVAPYIVAPIVSDEKWEQFFGTLPTLSESRGVREDGAAKIATVPVVESYISGEWDTALPTVPGVGVPLTT
ncbi:acyl-CoA dehydrogenase NM domain-like protein [Lactarius psammicola]|nr:acyl-CoA dehydrogenase NM domain-like protein [Lactarius psammicola]